MEGRRELLVIRYLSQHNYSDQLSQLLPKAVPPPIDSLPNIGPEGDIESHQLGLSWASLL